VPGPACYGRGGDVPTVTDADLVLGRIPADHPFPGLGALDVAAASSAFAAAGVDPEGVIAVVNAAMEQAVRTVTVARGVDPRSCALVAFGGAGPLHACALADALGITSVIVPARAGVLSAVGLLGAPLQRELVRSWPVPSSTEGIDNALEALAAEVRNVVGLEAATSTFLDVRYAGQSHELTVARVDDFHDEHARRNGYARPDAPVEVVALRARARIESPVSLDSLRPPPIQRRAAEGPEVIAEPDCTIWVAPGWAARVGSAGALVIER
jgi:N-methylhydantoinase A/oxoprolinase/acetone carboxylase beta subunit